MLAISGSFQPGMPISQTQGHHSEISSLLNMLIPTETNEGAKIVVQSPSLETQQHVRDRLLQIANESPESRSQVIQAMIEILNDPKAGEEFIVAHRWTEAVYVLGELRAVEGIDILVKNLNKTGENGLVSSIHYRPVASAIAKIGEPPVPRLIEALSDEQLGIRHEAAITLSRIGRQAVPKLEEALHYGSAEAKGGAALALSWIGGKKARAAIEQALESENDQETLSKLRDAFKEMQRVWENEREPSREQRLTIGSTGARQANFSRFSKGCVPRPVNWGVRRLLQANGSAPH